MTIVQINSACESGSTGKIVIALSQLMSQNNIENYVFYSGNKKSNYSLGEQINNKTDLRIHQLFSRIFGDQGWHSYYCTKNLVRKLKTLNPDIIHLHNLHGYYLNMDVLFKYLENSNIPVIWTFHDCWPFTGHCTHFSRVNCEKWKTECNECPQRSSYPYSWFIDSSLRLFNKKRKLYNGLHRLYITTVSDWLKGIVEQSELFKNRPVYVIPNGIDLNLFKEKEPLQQINGINIENKKIILGVANSWSKSKGLEDYIKLSKALGDDFQIVLVGLSPYQIKQVPKKIIGLSRTDSQEDLIRLYSTADVFFSPSTEETFGLTILEALACGTPVIVYNSTACPELVHYGCGYVVEVGAIESVKDIIELICKQGKQQYSPICRKAAEEYGQESIYMRYLNLYQKVLTENE